MSDEASPTYTEGVPVEIELAVPPGKEVETFELCAAVARQARQMGISFEAALGQAMELYVSKFRTSAPLEHPGLPESTQTPPLSQ